MQQAIDLQPLNLARLNKLRKQRSRDGKCDDYWRYWSELDYILQTQPSSSLNEWQKLEKMSVVGEVWKQYIGEYRYKHSVHEYILLHVESSGWVITEHAHTKLVNNGHQEKKVSQIYVFLSDGHEEVCGKDQTHSLFNEYDTPLDVLCINISGKGK